MISLLWKFLRSSFGHGTARADTVQVKEHSKQFGNTTETTIYNMTGTVTNICLEQSYGLINTGIYFHFNVVVENKQLNVGDQVIVSAERKRKACGFVASSVALNHTNWETMEAASSATDSKICSLSIEDFNPESVKVIDGFVTKLCDQFGILDHEFKFFMFDYEGETETRFQPCIGDKITGSLVTWNSQERVIAWKPKTLKKINGVVTFHETDWGAINDDVVYFIKSCFCDFPLVPELKVNAHIVESRNPPCFTWRAFSLMPCLGEEDCDWLEKPTIRESSDLYIDGDSDFHDVVLGETKCIRLVIKNGQDVPLTIVNIRFQKPPEKCPFVVNDVTIKVISANSEAIVTIFCKASAAVGRDSDLLIFEFTDFLLAHEVSINIVVPEQRLLNPTVPYEQQRRQQNVHKDLGSKVIIPGQKVFNPKANFKGFGPSFHVPKELRTAVEDSDNLLQVAPVLNEELNVANYCRRFSTLLHLEEIKMDNDMFQFSMREVVLRRQRSFLVLEVPGLAEGRPSLLIGDIALLSPPDQYSNLVYEGYIHEVHQNDIFLKFNQEFQASYNGETYDVTFQFSRSNMVQCHRCLRHVYHSKRYLLFPQYISYKKETLIRVYLNRNRTFSFQNGEPLEWYNKTLNFQQKLAIQRILEAQCRPFPYIVFGPPGTGKTVTLVEAVLQIYRAFKNARILICAPSNSAADLFAQRLLNSGIFGSKQLVRLNSYQRAVENIPEFIKPFCQDKEKIKEVLQSAIIISTCSTAGIFYRTDMAPNHFTHVFIDEACQLTEPESMIAVGIMSTHSNGSLVMAGDPKQLGSVIQSPLAKDYGLQIPYMERLMELPLYMRNEAKFENCNGYNPRLVTMLINCYRMHPDILQYPSTTFYHSELKCCVPEERHSLLSALDILPKKGFPIVFHGIQGSEEREESSPSWFNSAEIVQVTNYLRKLYANHIHPNDIGIITPYRKQVEKIRLFVDALKLERCKVGSVEEFQGQERRVIIISTVRSNTNFVAADIVHNLGFLCNPKRFNVAITRAQELLIVIGNPSVLSQDENWETFIRYCQVNGGYTGWSPLVSKD